MTDLPQNAQIAMVAIAGLITSLLTTWILVRKKSGWGMDTPDGVRKQHEVVVPRTGGLATFLGVAVGILLISQMRGGFTAGWWPVLLCCTLMFSLGFLDDLHPLGAKVKLLGQIGVALIIQLRVELIRPSPQAEAGAAVDHRLLRGWPLAPGREGAGVVPEGSRHADHGELPEEGHHRVAPMNESLNTRMSTSSVFFLVGN